MSELDQDRRTAEKCEMKVGGSLRKRAEGLVEFALILGLLVVVVAAIIVTVNQGSRKNNVATELEK